MLLHAQRHWPEYITTMLWLFTLLAAAEQMNNFHIDVVVHSSLQDAHGVAHGLDELSRFLLLCSHNTYTGRLVALMCCVSFSCD